MVTKIGNLILPSGHRIPKSRKFLYQHHGCFIQPRYGRIPHGRRGPLLQTHNTRGVAPGLDMSNQKHTAKEWQPGVNGTSTTPPLSQSTWGWRCRPRTALVSVLELTTGTPEGHCQTCQAEGVQLPRCPPQMHLKRNGRGTLTAMHLLVLDGSRSSEPLGNTLAGCVLSMRSSPGVHHFWV